MRAAGHIDPKDLPTSEVLRRSASWLDGLAEQGGYKRRDREEIIALAAELRLRALWIERGKTDPGISEERRKAIAAIDDVGGRS